MILGIETSCDDTSVALVAPPKRPITGDFSGGRIVAQRSFNQISEHAAYGGVVPEIAARSHLKVLDELIRGLLHDANTDLKALSGVAATAGPGLIGGVSVGVMTAKAISYAADLPFIAVNHLEGHALTVRLTQKTAFPYLLLLVSGGHCQLLWVRGVADYQKLGATLDDAVGEAFDKCAKLLGLPYPGGPAIEQAARFGDEKAYDLPRPLLGNKDKLCDFSLSGLKSAVRRLVIESHEKHGTRLPDSVIADICASFQASVGDIICDRVANGFTAVADKLRKLSQGNSQTKPLFVVAGGVAANDYLRRKLDSLCRLHGWRFAAPPPQLCTDNGAMIGWVGWERLQMGVTDGLDFAPLPRWDLEDLRL